MIRCISEPGASVIAPSWPTSEHSSATITQSPAVAVLGVGGLRRGPRRRGRAPAPRAGSRRRCRGTGCPRSRAVRTAASAPSALAVRAAGDDPDARRSPRASCGVLARDPVRVEHEVVAAAQRVDQLRDAGVGADARGAVADEGDGGGGHDRDASPRVAFTSNDRSVCFALEIVMDPRFLRTFAYSRPARLVLRRRARARLHAVGGLPAHRRAGGRAGRAAAAPPPGRADRGGRAAARARRADPAAARGRARGRDAGGRPGRRDGCAVGATPLSAGLAARAVARRGASGRRWTSPLRVGAARRDRRSPWPPASSTRASSTASPPRATRCGCRRPGLPVAESLEDAARRRAARPATRCGRARRASRTSPTRAGSTRPASPSRSTTSPRSPAPRASGRRCATTGSTSGGLLALVAAGQGLALLPGARGAPACRCAAPRARAPHGAAARR